MLLRIAIIVAIVAAAAWALWHPAAAPLSRSNPSPAPSRHPARALPTGPPELVVYVAGAVRRPGLYHLTAGSRAADAVALAGGPNAQADPAGVNLAARLNDGDEVFVPRADESPPRRAPPKTRARRRRKATVPAVQAVDVNAAGSAELAAVPGIGRAIASRIVETRDRDGAFSSLDELLDVAGMTPARLERARPYLRPP